MKQKRYAIIDLETTGGKAMRDRITEIAIVIHDGTQIINQWETLINPECYIPYGITQLTGITQEMVEDAPKFYEVAKQVVELTEDTIFVAHNVRFDYGFIRAEFQRLGYAYTRKQLCTVRLSRKTFPGLRSYSLGNLIQHFNIEVDARHRAMADTLATVDIFERILNQKNGVEEVKEMVNLGIKESLLPANLSLEKMHELPEACGVYYFHDENGNLAYVGKSINIKKRVAEHFAKVTEKARKLQRVVHDISYELTGSELIALLLESEHIKTQRPYINRAQRTRSFPFAIHTFEDEAGYIRFQTGKPVGKERKQLNILAEFHKLGHANGRLKRVIRTFQLCPKLAGIESDHRSGLCFDYHLKKCNGACGSLEPAAAYNERAAKAMEFLSTSFDEDFFVIDDGRHPNERSVVLVEDNTYKGFGYIDADQTIENLEDLRSVIDTRYADNPEVKKIIRLYLIKNPKVQRQVIH